MRFDKLDLNLLVALDALLSEQSVTGASKRLFLSQPAVTAALNRLRDFFGDELLVLEGRKMRLTYKAEQLSAPVKQVLELVRREITQPGNFDPSTSTRKFVIVCSDYFQTVLMSEVISTISRQAPKVSIEITRPSSAADERFERGEADLMVTVTPISMDHHPSLPLFGDEHVLVTWKGADFADEISAEEFLLAGHAAVTFGRDRRPALSEILLEGFRDQRRIELLVPSFTALAQSVVGTNRIATMHRRLAEHFKPLYPIRLHNVPVTLPPIQEILTWHRLRAQDSGMIWLRNLIVDCSDRKFGKPVGGADERSAEFRLDR